MLRIRAVKSLLLEEIAGLSLGEPEMGNDDSLEDLRRAEKKALTVVVLCWVAIAVLFVTHQGPIPFLRFDGIETVFTLGILLIAVYSGFRLGQWEKYRAVARLYDELAERQPEREG